MSTQLVCKVLPQTANTSRICTLDGSAQKANGYLAMLLLFMPLSQRFAYSQGGHRLYSRHSRPMLRAASVPALMRPSRTKRQPNPDPAIWTGRRLHFQSAQDWLLYADRFEDGVRNLGAEAYRSDRAGPLRNQSEATGWGGDTGSSGHSCWLFSKLKPPQFSNW